MAVRLPPRAPRVLTRRSLLHGLAAAPLLSSLACTDDAAPECETANTWASGGTAAMTLAHEYPDPFAASVASCTLACETIVGPCTSDVIERQDISEAWPGLPVRLALKLVDAGSCAPVVGALVEVWHTQRSGVYSGVTPGAAACYGDDPDAENHLYFRGSQTTDAEGRVDFDTCYPGWYPGRAIHIHFRVLLGGQAYLTSQLFFGDALSAEIFACHPDYVEFGQPDTLEADDLVSGGGQDITPHRLDTARMPDGAMLAWKLVAIRSSLAEAPCVLG